VLSSETDFRILQNIAPVHQSVHREGIGLSL
jgi:hypothetical protein